MRRPHLSGLTPVVIPDGYLLRPYQPGDEAHWCAIMEGNIGSGWSVDRCRSSLLDDDRFSPHNLVFIVTDQGLPVATACAWCRQGDSSEGQLHMVAAVASHRGKGLGGVINTAVLHRLAELGFRSAHLLTDDFRIPAIRSYLTSGFRPHYTHASHGPRWESVLQSIGLSTDELSDGPE